MLPLLRIEPLQFGDVAVVNIFLMMIEDAIPKLQISSDAVRTSKGSQWEAERETGELFAKS